MKTIRIVFSFILVTGLATLSGWAQAKPTVTGEWVCQVINPHSGEIALAAKFTQHDDGKVTGTVSSPAGTNEIFDGKLADNVLSFKVTVKQPQQEFTAHYTAKLDGDKLSGSVETPFGQADFSGARKTAPENQSNIVAKVDAWLQPLVQAQQFSGVILISQNGKLIFEKAYGLANAELNVPNQLNTRFNIASVTKAMTRAVAVRLLEERKLGIQDKLSKFIPDFPNGEQITVELLIRHRSGILHRVTRPEEETVPYTPAEMVEKAKAAKLAFPPGTARLYSSAGYAVLARVLEIAAGKPYSQLLQEYIFTPAGMKDAVDFNGEEILARRAQEYMLEANGLVHAPLKDYSFLVGAGSVFSTAHDIYRFAEAVLDGKFGPSVRQSLQDDEGVFDDNGSTNGFRCNFRIDRKKGYAFLLLSNLESGANEVLIRDLPLILEGKEVAPATVPQRVLLPQANKTPADFTGRYALDNTTFEITLVRNQLFAGRLKLYPIGKDRFFIFGAYADLTFVRNADGAIKELQWNAPGVERTWVRQPAPQVSK